MRWGLDRFTQVTCGRLKATISCVAILVIPAMLALCTPASATTYGFELTGRLTQVTGNHPGFAVGDPFLLRYDADDHDSDNDPSVGVYLASRPVAFIRGQQLIAPGANTAIVVSLNPNNGPFVRYTDVTGPDRFLIQIILPNGTLLSDQLPLSLTLDEVPSRVFGFSSSDFSLSGRLESYVGQIPEPASSALLILAVLARLRARRFLTPELSRLRL